MHGWGGCIIAPTNSFSMNYLLQEKLFPCLYKSIFGIDCPMCGFQRASLMVLKGDLKGSFKMYPPLLPCIILIFYAILYSINDRLLNKNLLKQFANFVIVCIIVNYLLKIVVLISI